MSDADDIQDLRNQLATVTNILNQWRQNGLDTLVMQRAFTSGGQKVRIDRQGIQITLPQNGTPDQYWFHSTTNPGSDYSTQFPHVDGLTGQSTNTSYLQFLAYGSSLADQANLTVTGQDSAGSSAQLQVLTGSTVTATLQVAAASGGYVQVNPRILFTSLSSDPSTGLDGSMWFNSTAGKYRGRVSSTFNFVTSDSTADDLTQYALLAGRSGGQILKGDTASGGSLTLQSTAHATKGRVKFGGAAVSYYDEPTEMIRVGASGNTVQLGVGMAAGSVPGVSLDYNQLTAGTATLRALNNGVAWLPINIDCLSVTVNPAGVASKFTVDQNFNVVVGSAAIATNATNGFLYIPTCAGTPTGTPTAMTGRIPMVYDTTNHQFWFYDVSWKQPKTVGTLIVVDWQ